MVKDAWGIPVLRFDYRFGDNEMKMAEDMADRLEEMLKAAGAEDIKVRASSCPRAGPSTRSAPRAWGTTPRRR